MIAVESIKKYKFRDVEAILIFAFISFIISYLVDFYFSPEYAYIISLLAFTFLLSFIVHLVRKAGVAVIYSLLVAVFSSGIYDIGVEGIYKVIAFFIIGVVFEAVYLVLKLELKYLQLDIIIGTSLAAAALPISIGFLLSTVIATKFTITMINLVLLSFFIGLAGSVLSFIVWRYLRTTKWVLKYEYDP